MILAAHLLIISFFFFLKLFIFIAYTENLSIEPLPLFTICLSSVLLNEDIADIKKPDEISLLTFTLNEISGLFLYPSIFSIIHSTSA